MAFSLLGSFQEKTPVEIYSAARTLARKACRLFANIAMPVYYYRFKICRTVTLPVVLYGCETWSLTLREKHRLRVFENTVLRKIHGSKRDEVTGEWRRQHNGELYDK